MSPRLPVYLSAVAIAIFILLFASTAHKPYHLDNVDFPAVAEATANTGLPLYYRGEEHPRMSGLYHPPLYIYTLAAWMRVFGPGEAQTRLFGMVCALLLGWVVLEIVRTLFGREVMRRWTPVFWVLYLLNPYTLQTATIADIDSTIYGPLLCGVLLAVLRISWRDGVWRTDPVRLREYGLVVLLLTLCLWAKLTTVLLTFPVVFLLLIARSGVRRALIASSAAGALGIGVFALTYWLYGALTSMPVSETLAFTWMSFTQRGSSSTPGLLARLADYRRNAAFMLPFMASWTGLLPWVAGAAALAVAAGRAWKARDPRMQHYAATLGLGLLATAYYSMKVMTFGYAPFKYTLVYWPLVLTAPLFLLSGRDWSTSLKVTATLSCAAFAAGAVFGTRFLQDRLMHDQFVGPYKLAAYLPALLFAAGWALRGRGGLALAALSLALYCGMQFGSGVYQEQIAYATTYDYGQTGLVETAAFISANTGPDDVIASMKDVGFLTKRRYYENYQAIYLDGSSRVELVKAIESGRVSYVVFTEGRGQDQLRMNPVLRDWIRDNCTLVRSFGDYRVYMFNETLRKRRTLEGALW